MITMDFCCVDARVCTGRRKRKELGKDTYRKLFLLSFTIHLYIRMKKDTKINLGYLQVSLIQYKDMYPFT